MPHDSPAAAAAAASVPRRWLCSFIRPTLRSLLLCSFSVIRLSCLSSCGREGERGTRVLTRIHASLSHIRSRVGTHAVWREREAALPVQSDDVYLAMILPLFSNVLSSSRLFSPPLFTFPTPPFADTTREAGARDRKDGANVSVAASFSSAHLLLLADSFDCSPLVSPLTVTAGASGACTLTLFDA